MMLTMKTKITLRLSFFIIFTSFIIMGLLREEIWDIISNATLICFACIGIK